MRDRAALDLGIPFSEFGELVPRELDLRYRKAAREAERRLDDVVAQAWWNGLFVRAAYHAEEYPDDVRDFLPSTAEERAEAKRKERESWTIDDCKHAVGLM